MNDIFQIILLYFVTCMTLNAQQSVVAAGKDISSTSGTVSFSIGQVVNQSNDDGIIYETQGVQQPYEIIASVIGRDDQMGSVSFQVFPNPTTSELRLFVDQLPDQSFSYELIDVVHRVVRRDNIQHQSMHINIRNLSPNVYFLRLLSDGSVKQVFKIIKNSSK